MIRLQLHNFQKEGVGMKELYLIMDDFLKVEYRQKALLSVLKALEGFYSEEEQEELKLLVSSVKWDLEALQEEMKECIGKLDNYIVLSKNRNK